MGANIDRCIITTYFYTILGETFERLQYLYRIPSQTIGHIVPETCSAIVDVLQEEYTKVNNNIIIDKFKK